MKNLQLHKIAITIIALLLPTTTFASFTDVPQTHPYYNAIMTAQKEGIMKGYADESFKPDKIITKAEFIKTVFNHAGYKPIEKLYKTPFKDVPPGSWFAPYVKKGYTLGLIILNTEIQKFFPQQPVSRIDAIKLIIPLEGIPAPLTSNEPDLIFNDIKPASADSHYILAAQKSGIFIPEETPVFFPQKNLTRGETAMLLHKAELYRGITNDLKNSIQTDINTIEVAPTFQEGQSLIDNPKFPILINVWNKINTNYIYKDKIDQDQLVYGAIDGMVQTLDDEHSLFQDPTNSKDLTNQLDGTYEGIGTVIDSFEDEFIIIAVIKNSPADKAGLKAGDIIIEVNKQNVSGYSIKELTNNIKGIEGTTVKLKIKREKIIKTFRIKREKIVLNTVLIESNVTIPKDIAYAAIYQFTDSTANEFKDLLLTEITPKTKGIIIDLRDNPGGYVDSAYEILDIFIPKNKTLITVKYSNETIKEESQGTNEITIPNIPIMILVNENTASAAEIVASSMQSNKKATIIGTKTYGKGTMQEINIYEDGSLFKLSIAEWLGPNEEKIDEKGLIPDIIVKTTKNDILGKSDSQLERAIKEIEKRSKLH